MLIFASMLILSSSIFGSCLFSSHAYYRVNAYFRETTVYKILYCSSISKYDFVTHDSVKLFLAMMTFSTIHTCIMSMTWVSITSWKVSTCYLQKKGKKLRFWSPFLVLGVHVGMAIFSKRKHVSHEIKGGKREEFWERERVVDEVRLEVNPKNFAWDFFIIFWNAWLQSWLGHDAQILEAFSFYKYNQVSWKRT